MPEPEAAVLTGSAQPVVEASSSRKPNAPWWIKFFVAFHLFAITIYALPLPPEGVRSGKLQPFGTDWILYLNWKFAKPFPLVQSYTFSTGFWQYWDMFGPDPVFKDQYCTSQVIYQNGKVADYQYPRMALLSIPDKFLLERYRKFYERAHDLDESEQSGLKGYVRQRFAQRIALLNDKYPGNPPVEVKLYFHEWEVPKPGGNLTPKYTSFKYFDYIVDQDQLAYDKAGVR